MPLSMVVVLRWRYDHLYMKVDNGSWASSRNGYLVEAIDGGLTWDGLMVRKWPGWAVMEEIGEDNGVSACVKESANVV
ncbi:unnamed protein product [Dovyalis caffra]|uniref:Uncharacterized protein n=1 Tax=Dovyalis caffra TaxID=77055 RepID=A0AAV1SNP6_9ROSI|nr:unnamed protein product [Dovyalis caffra]